MTHLLEPTTYRWQCYSSNNCKRCFLEQDSNQKWNSNEPSVISTIPEELKETNKSVAIRTKPSICQNIGNRMGHNNGLNPCISISVSPRGWTHQMNLAFEYCQDLLCLGLDVTYHYHVLQHTWEARINWDDPVPNDLVETWILWKSKLPF